MATDRSGNVFISGSTASTSGIATPGSYQSTYGGGTDDVFLAKFNPSGSIQWASYFGGASDDQAYAIACDDSGSVYITGSTASTSGIATPGAYQVTNGGGARDTYIGKFSGAGAIQWASYFGGAATDFGVSVVTLGRKVFVAGITNSTSAIATPGAYQAIYGGGIQDAFLAEFSSTGAIQWATYYGA